jgi:hypothetical protein
MGKSREKEQREERKHGRGYQAEGLLGNTLCGGSKSTPTSSTKPAQATKKTERYTTKNLTNR